MILTIFSIDSSSWVVPIAKTVFVSRLKLTPAVVRDPKAPVIARATVSGAAYSMT